MALTHARFSTIAASLVLGAVALPACHDGSGSTSSQSIVDGRYFVRVGAAPGGDGKTWASAFRSLHDALAVARLHDELWVAAGTYRPAAPGGDRAVSFALKNKVKLYGGFAGGETSLALRDPTAHPTILSGDLNGDDGADFANTAENSYHVVTAINVSEDTLLDGFFVRAGRADGPGFGATPASQDQGSGINIYDAAPVIRNCTIEQNWSLNHGAVNDHGMATAYDHCTFRNNHSEGHGAGLYLHHHAMSMVTACAFYDNHAGTDGGGSYCRSLKGAEYVDCWFEGNTAERGGGLFVIENANPLVEQCTFLDNSARTGGGGMYSDIAIPHVHQCHFLSNEAGVGIGEGGGGGGGSGGGGLWTAGGMPLITECMFEANTASFGAGSYSIFDSQASYLSCTWCDNEAREGAGLYVLFSPVFVDDGTFEDNESKGGDFPVGGGASIYFSNAEIERSVFRRNTAARGGGALYQEGEFPSVRASRFEANASPGGNGGAIFNSYFCKARVENCVLVGNRAAFGGAIADLGWSKPLVVNCTITNNSAAVGGGVADLEFSNGTYENCIVVQNGGSSFAGFGSGRVDYSIVEGGMEGGADAHVFDVDPRFRRAPSPGPSGTWGDDDDDYGDLRLQAGSPGIDAGWNRPLFWLVEVDMDGNPRHVDDPAVLDTGRGVGPILDMGAFERQL